MHPPKRSDMRRQFAYLTGKRLIDWSVVQVFVKAGLIYEDAKHHNAVFLDLDEMTHKVKVKINAVATLTLFTIYAEAYLYFNAHHR